MNQTDKQLEDCQPVSIDWNLVMWIITDVIIWGRVVWELFH